MKKFVKIASERTIQVTGGLQTLVRTPSDTSVQNRLNARPLFSDLKILIKKGNGYYPSVIKEWNTVKSLIKDGVLFVAEEVDTCPNQAEVEQNYERLMKAYKTIEEIAKTNRTIGVEKKFKKEAPKKVEKPVEEEKTETIELFNEDTTTLNTEE